MVMTKAKKEQLKELRSRIVYLEKTLKEETCWIVRGNIRRSISRIKNEIEEISK
jgi:hypothetical protein